MQNRVGLFNLDPCVQFADAGKEALQIDILLPAAHDPIDDDVLIDCAQEGLGLLGKLQHGSL